MYRASARKHLATNLRIIRFLRGWSQEELAELTGLDRSYIGGLERAERNVGVDTLEKLADALGLSIAQLTSEPDAKIIGEQVLERIRETIEKLPPGVREEPAVYLSSEPARLYWQYYLAVS